MGIHGDILYCHCKLLDGHHFLCAMGIYSGYPQIVGIHDDILYCHCKFLDGHHFLCLMGIHSGLPTPLLASVSAIVGFKVAFVSSILWAFTVSISTSTYRGHLQWHPFLPLWASRWAL